MENYDKYQELLEASKNSAGTAESKYGAYRDSLQAATSGLTAAWEKIVNDAEINNILKDLTKLLTNLVELIPELLKHLPSIIAAIENVKALSGNSILQKAGGYLGKQFGSALFGERGILGQTKFGINYRIKQINADYDRRMREAKRNGELTAEREAELIKARDEEIQVIKKSAAVKKQDTEATQEGAAAKKEEVSTTKEAVATEQQEAQANQQSAATEEQESAANQQSTMSEKQEVAANQLAVQSEMQETQANQRSAASEGGGSRGGAGKMSKAGAAMAGVSVIANQALAGLTAFSTQGTTHTNEYGETVESSEEAQKAGSGWAALATFAIPLFGSWIGEKIAQKVTSEIDRERDAVNHLTSISQKNLSGIRNLTSGIEAMSDVGSKESIDAADQFLASIFSSENEATRKVLEKYLGESGSIYDIVNQIKEGNEEAYRKLKVAQLEAEKSQIIGNYGAQVYKKQQDVNNAYNAYDNYVATGGNDQVAKGALLGAAGGAGVGAMAGGAAVALGASGPVGWIIGGVALLVGLGFGIAAGIKQRDAERKAEADRHARQALFNAMTYAEKIESVETTLKQAEQEGNASVVDKCNELLEALNEQKALVNQINNEINKVTEQQALYTAKVGGQYLTNLSTVALQDAGIDAIVEAYAKALEENGGLLGYELFDKNGALTESGYQYALTHLKQQGDEQVNAVLSGGAYTLSEILKLRQKYGDQRWIMSILENFATALNIPIDILENFENRFGSLKLSELLLSTNEIDDLVGSYTNLLSAITTGAGDTSKWMETIISQFPELIAYMGDTNTLFSHMTTKIFQLSDAYVQSQYSDVIGSTEFYKSIRESLESRLSQENIKQLTNFGVDSVSSILDWIQQQYDVDSGTLNNAGTEVLKALEETVDEYGITITSNILKSYYEQIIDFRVKTLDKELENLNAQKEALQNINSEREYENKLIEAKLKLEDASKEKKRVYRAGVGWVYEADQTAIAEAQKELESLETQKTIAELDQQIAELTYQKEKISGIFDQKNYETLSNLYKAYTDQAGVQNASSEQLYQLIKEGTDGIQYALEELISQDVEAKAAEKSNALSKAKKAWEVLQGEKYGTASYNTALHDYHNAYQAAMKAGATESDFEDWGTAHIGGNSNAHSMGAYATGQGEMEKQMADAKMYFRLNDTNTPSQYFSGLVSLAEPQYNTGILGNIFEDLIANLGWIWTKDRAGFTPLDDYRFSIRGDASFLDYIKRIQQEEGVPNEIVFTGYDGINESVYVRNGIPYKIVGNSNTEGMDIITGPFGGQIWGQEKMARGALDFMGGNALINELGTEAIVTPYGTLTSLPSHTGVVPADITRNLWELGEVAPMIQRQLMGSFTNDLSHKTIWGNDESLNIGSMYMTLNADSSFDIDAFVDAMKTHVVLNKNNRR